MNTQNENTNNTDFSPDYYIVCFKSDRRDFFIDRSHTGFKQGEWVVVQAERGRDIGRISVKIKEKYMQNHSERRYPLEILKKAEEEDLAKFDEIRKDEEHAIKTCQELVYFHGLDMKLVDAEYQFDGKKLNFYYTADQRVDFRELVKDLAAHFRTRIELRQIGVRDEAKKVGGLAPCGRELCCSLFLEDFKPVTSQLARDQQLAVNPSKISGLCGRLICCLTYEEPFYKELHRIYPHDGDKLATDFGIGDVVAVDIIRDKIMLRFAEEDIKQYNLAGLRRIMANRQDFLEKWKPRNSEDDNKGSD